MPGEDECSMKLPGLTRPLPPSGRPVPTARASRDARAESFAELYQQQFRRVYAFLRYRLDDAQLAEDLAAEVFARAWASLRDPRQADSSIAWLFTTARRLVADHYRRQRPLLPIEEAPPRPAAAVPEAQLLAGERLALVLRHLAALGEREREVVGLRFLAGLRNRQIAQVLGMSEGNVAKIIHRALAKVRERLQEEGYDV